MKCLIFTSLFFFVLNGLSSTLLAQTDPNKRSVTVVYSKVKYQRSEKDREVFNLLKINPLLVFNGDFPLYFERRIKDQLSLEGSLGVTYTDYIYQFFSLTETPYENSARTSKVGYSVSGAIKFYPSKYTKALDEFYFGFEIRHRVYNSQIPLDPNSGTSVSNYLPENRNLTDFKFILGYIDYVSDRVILEYYGGIGLRQRNVALGYYDVNTSGSQAVLDTKNDMVPVISAGLKIGFGL